MAFYLKKEDGSYLLKEDGGKIILQEGSSPSPSPSVSPSSSSSVSVSPSSSSSRSVSPSASASSTPSPSPSASPSIGYSLYTRNGQATLPTNNNDLATTYTEQEETNVSTRDNTFVGQVGAGQYMIHEFKSFIGAQTQFHVEFEGHTTLAPSSSPVYLQIYNQVSLAWETIDTEGDAPEDIDFEMEAKITSVTNYKDADNVVSCRVYQRAI